MATTVEDKEQVEEDINTVLQKSDDAVLTLATESPSLEPVPSGTFGSTPMTPAPKTSFLTSGSTVKPTSSGPFPMGSASLRRTPATSKSISNSHGEQTAGLPNTAINRRFQLGDLEDRGEICCARRRMYLHLQICRRGRSCTGKKVQKHCTYGEADNLVTKLLESLFFQWYGEQKERKEFLIGHSTGKAEHLLVWRPRCDGSGPASLSLHPFGFLKPFAALVVRLA